MNWRNVFFSQQLETYRDETEPLHSRTKHHVPARGDEERRVMEERDKMEKSEDRMERGEEEKRRK